MSYAFSTNYPLFFGRAVVGSVRIGPSFHVFTTMNNVERLLLTLAHPLRCLTSKRPRQSFSRTDLMEPIRIGAASTGEADFRDCSLLPLLRAETLDRFEPPASWSAGLADEARAYVEDELRLAWEGPARMTDRPNEDWGRAYDFTVKEGSRDPFLAWMSVVGQHKWHWDDQARAQLAALEAGLAALPPESEPFRRLLATHARQLLDPSEDHARALCAAAVRWAESHAAHPDRSEAVLRILAQFVDTANPALVPALLRSSSDPWIAFTLGGDAALARACAASSEKAFSDALSLAASSCRRARERHPGFPQGAAGMVAVCGLRNDRKGLRRWFARGVEARFDFVPLHDLYVCFLRPSRGGSIDELRAYADACLAPDRPDSMLPWCAAMARIVDLEASGLSPREFFSGNGESDRLERAIVSFLGRANGTEDALSEAAEFLACLRWSRGDVEGAEKAVLHSRNKRYRRILQEGFPGAFDILETLFGLTGPNAAIVRPLWRRFRDGDANGFLRSRTRIEPSLPSLSRSETSLLASTSLQAFLATGFLREESYRIPFFDHGYFVGWFCYGTGWQPSDNGHGGFVFTTGATDPSCLELAQALPLPIELDISMFLAPRASDSAPFFTVRILPMDRRFLRHRGSTPPISFRRNTSETLSITVGDTGDPFADDGWRGGIIASAQSVSSPPSASNAPPSSPQDRISTRIVLDRDHVSVFLGGASDPALSAPCTGFAPERFPEGAKLVFFGHNARFHGFSFRKTSPALTVSREGGTAP